MVPWSSCVPLPHRADEMCPVFLSIFSWAWNCLQWRDSPLLSCLQEPPTSGRFVFREGLSSFSAQADISGRTIHPHFSKQNPLGWASELLAKEWPGGTWEAVFFINCWIPLQRVLEQICKSELYLAGVTSQKLLKTQMSQRSADGWSPALSTQQEGRKYSLASAFLWHKTVPFFPFI